MLYEIWCITWSAHNLFGWFAWTFRQCAYKFLKAAVLAGWSTVGFTFSWPGTSSVEVHVVLWWFGVSITEAIEDIISGVSPCVQVARCSTPATFCQCVWTVGKSTVGPRREAGYCLTNWRKQACSGEERFSFSDRNLNLNVLHLTMAQPSQNHFVEHDGGSYEHCHKIVKTCHWCGSLAILLAENDCKRHAHQGANHSYINN